jgi:hypothetical protein
VRTFDDAGDVGDGEARAVGEFDHADVREECGEGVAGKSVCVGEMEIDRERERERGRC